MNSGFENLQELERQILEMSRTESPAELFKVLREACRLAAPRGSVFLVRQGRIQGWSAFGYQPAVNEALRGFSCGLNEGWLGEIVSDREVTSAPRDPATGEPDFGQPRAADAVISVVRIQGRPIALVVVERQTDEEPWHPEVTGLLVTSAQLRLELDLALRKLQTKQQEAQKQTQTEPTESPAETPPATVPEPVPDVAAEPSPVPAEVTAVEPIAEDQAEDQPDLEAARRYARLVATDIRLYNEEAVALGRQNGDLERRLEEHLDRGKETFLSRHADLGTTGLDLLLEAYVQVLAAGDTKLLPPSVVR